MSDLLTVLYRLSTANDGDEFPIQISKNRKVSELKQEIQKQNVAFNVVDMNLFLDGQKLKNTQLLSEIQNLSSKILVLEIGSGANQSAQQGEKQGTQAIAQQGFVTIPKERLDQLEATEDEAISSRNKSKTRDCEKFFRDIGLKITYKEILKGKTVNEELAKEYLKNLSDLNNLVSELQKQIPNLPCKVVGKKRKKDEEIQYAKEQDFKSFHVALLSHLSTGKMSQSEKTSVIPPTTFYGTNEKWPWRTPSEPDFFFEKQFKGKSYVFIASERKSAFYNSQQTNHDRHAVDQVAVVASFLSELWFERDETDVVYCIAASAGVVSLHSFTRSSTKSRKMEKLVQVETLKPPKELVYTECYLNSVKRLLLLGHHFFNPSLTKSPWTQSLHNNLLKESHFQENKDPDQSGLKNPSMVLIDDKANEKTGTKKKSSSQKTSINLKEESDDDFEETVKSSSTKQSSTEKKVQLVDLTKEDS